MRLQIYNWFNRWLKGVAVPITEEPPVEPEPDQNLWVAPTGNVVRSFGGHTPLTLLKQRRPDRSRQWREVLAPDFPAPDLRPTVLGRVPFRNANVSAIEVPAAPKVWVPAWLYEPRPAAARQTLLVLESGGRNSSRWSENGLYAQRAAEGRVVCAADLRGIGDLAPEFPRGAARHARPRQDEEGYAWSSLIFGKPLLGQRVTDILALVRALHNLAGRKVVLAAQGKLTIPALFAAALDPNIDLLYLAAGLVSYRALVEAEEYRHPTASFAFGLLQATDLPEIAASLAPRRVVLAGTVDALGRPLSPALVRETYTAGNVEVRADANWDLQFPM
jgi:hypothetical protein